MKRAYSLLIFFVFLVFCYGIAHAQIRPGAIAITPMFGGYTFEGNQELKTGPLYGIRAGFDFTKNFGAEILYSYVPTEFKPNDRRTNVHNYRIEGLYHFFPDKKFIPFAAIGIGGTTLNYPNSEGRKTRGVFDYGLGLKYFLFKNMALRGDVRHVITSGSIYNNLEYTFGLTFYFGGKEQVIAAASPPPSPPPPPPPPPPPKVVDSDGDGVPDELDKCPDTPKGFKVGPDGCCLDSDGDGIRDCLDKCPDTPKGVEVDKDGCPIVVVPKAAPVMNQKEKEIVEKGKVRLNVLFDFNKWNIKPKYHNELKEFADVMIKYPELKVVIEGHTDNIGGAAYNMKLSQRRAESIRKYLIEKFKIEPERIKAVGYGLTRPIASNKTSQGRQLNRRVEAVAEYPIKAK